MAYDSTKEATIVVGREYHDMLKKMAKADRRGLRDTTELVIEQVYQTYTKENT